VPTKGDYADTMKARMFAALEYKEPERTERRVDLIGKIHKQIAHLTLDRAGAEHNKLNGNDRADLRKMLMDDLERFTKCLKVPQGASGFDPRGEDAG
jgi:hypothetical protein